MKTELVDEGLQEMVRLLYGVFILESFIKNSAGFVDRQLPKRK